MCGIAGIAGGAAPEEVLNAMGVAMATRGPDASAVWIGENAGLGFRRLAIIDLDERANQPMALGSLRMVFNGEIYDYLERRKELEGLGHVFTTSGDGEVLLHAWHAWGEAALDRINGMFAVAVYDVERRALTLARDAFGEKPLLYVQDGDRLVFASDLRALAQAVPVGPPDSRA